MNLKRVIIALAILLFLAGLLVQYIQTLQYIPYKENAIAKTVQTESSPVKIVIPRIGINAQVKPGGIVNGKWILSDTYVHYFSLSQSDNKTIFYAHERKNLFVNLKQVIKGDKILVTDETGKITIYEVYSTERILPTQFEKLNAEAHTITLYTCDGAFDQNRLLVKAKLTNIN